MRYREYYRGERISNAAIFFLGGGALFWSLILFAWRQGHLSAGIFFSTVPLSFFFMMTGAYRFWRSFRRYKQDIAPEQLINYLLDDEKHHLDGRCERFRAKRKVDSIGVLVGFAGIVIGLMTHGSHVYIGFAMVIAVFSAMLLAFDLFGQFRSEEFLHHINKLKRARVTP